MVVHRASGRNSTVHRQSDKPAEQAAKEPWELSPVADKSAALDELRGVICEDLAAAYKLTD